MRPPINKIEVCDFERVSDFTHNKLCAAMLRWDTINGMCHRLRLLDKSV